MNCPAFEELLDYLDSRLADAAAETVSAHLATGCARCNSDRAWYEEVRRIAASDDSLEPPAWILKRAVKIFDARGSRSGAVRRVTRRVASLMFDSLQRPSLAGARSGGVDGRQLLYKAEDYSIDLQVASLDQSRVSLTGQILREGEMMFESVAGLQLDLTRDGGIILSTVTNDRGEFRVEALDYGSYDLRLDTNDASITIVGLPIG